MRHPSRSLAPTFARRRPALLLALALLGLPAVAGAGEARVERRVSRDVREIAAVERQKASLLAGGRRGFLGVHVLELTPELRHHFRAGDAGVLVSRVEEGSPAAQAGVAAGDVLVAVDGEPVRSSFDLKRLVAPREEGEVVALDVVRDGRAQRFEATLVEREARILELGPIVRHDEHGRALLVLPSEEEWEELGRELGRIGEEVGEAVGEALSRPEVRRRIELEVETRAELERKIQLLERRLKELERRLAEQRR